MSKVLPGINWDVIIGERKHPGHSPQSVHGRRGAGLARVSLFGSQGGKDPGFAGSGSAPLAGGGGGGEVSSILDDPHHGKDVRAFEDKFAGDRKREHAFVVGADGTQTYVDGDAMSVGLPTDKIRDGHITHNHPGVAMPFSTQDIYTLSHDNVRTMRAVSRDPSNGDTYEYEVKRPKNGWPKPDADGYSGLVKDLWHHETVEFPASHARRLAAGEYKGMSKYEAERHAYLSAWEDQQPVFKKHKVRATLRVRKGNATAGKALDDSVGGPIPAVVVARPFVPAPAPDGISILDDSGLALPLWPEEDKALVIDWGAIIGERKHPGHSPQSVHAGMRGHASPALHSGGGRLSQFRENRSGPGGSVMDHPAHAKAVGEFEDKIKQDQSQEHAMVVNSDGSVAVMTSGRTFQVEIKTKGPGAHVTHNHPKPPGAPLSADDVAVAKDANLRSMRAVSYDRATNTTYEYEIQRPAKGWSERMVWDAIRVEDRWQKKYSPRLRAGETEEEVTKDAYPDLYEMQKTMFDKYGAKHSLKKYKGRRRKGLEATVPAPVDLQGEDLESIVEQSFLIDDSSVMSFGEDIAKRAQEKLRIRMAGHEDSKSIDWSVFLAEKAKKPKKPSRWQNGHELPPGYDPRDPEPPRPKPKRPRQPKRESSGHEVPPKKPVAPRKPKTPKRQGPDAPEKKPPPPAEGPSKNPKESGKPDSTVRIKPPKQTPLGTRVGRAIDVAVSKPPTRQQGTNVVGRMVDAAIKPPSRPTRKPGENTAANVGLYTSQKELDRAIERALLASSPERMVKELEKLLKHYTPEQINERIRSQFVNEIHATAEGVVRGVAKKLNKEKLYEDLRQGIKDFRTGMRGGAAAQERRAQPRRLLDRAVQNLSDELDYSPFGWRFNKKSQRWEQIVPHKEITPEQAQKWLDKRLKASQERMARYARTYANKNMSQQAFLAKMHHELIYIHTSARLLAIGGRGNAGPKDWGTMGRQLRKEFEWVAKFAEYRDGTRFRHMNPEYAQRRARLYAGTNVKSTYYRGLTDSHMNAGFMYKKRYGPHDDGTCKTCRYEIERGWVSIHEPGWEVGHTECRIGDRCGIQYAKDDDAKAMMDILHKHPGHSPQSVHGHRGAMVGMPSLGPRTAATAAGAIHGAVRGAVAGGGVHGAAVGAAVGGARAAAVAVVTGGGRGQEGVVATGSAFDDGFGKETKSVLDHPVLGKKVKDFEHAVVGDKEREHAMVVEDNGEVSIFSGTKEAASIATKTSGAHVTHNHPGVGSPLSGADFQVATGKNLRSIRAVSVDPDTGDHFSFEVRRPKFGWPDGDGFINAIAKAENEWRSEIPERDRSMGATSKYTRQRRHYEALTERQKKVLEKHRIPHTYTVTRGRLHKAGELPLPADAEWPESLPLPSEPAGNVSVLDDSGLTLPPFLEDE